MSFEVVAVQMGEIDAVAKGEGMRHSLGPVCLEELVSKMLSEEGEEGVRPERSRLKLLPDEKSRKRGEKI